MTTYICAKCNKLIENCGCLEPMTLEFVSIEAATQTFRDEVEREVERLMTKHQNMPPIRFKPDTRWIVPTTEEER